MNAKVGKRNQTNLRRRFKKEREGGRCEGESGRGEKAILSGMSRNQGRNSTVTKGKRQRENSWRSTRHGTGLKQGVPRA